MLFVTFDDNCHIPYGGDILDKFAELCQENYERIYKYIYLRLKNKERTEDAVQNVFLIAYEKGKAFTEHPNPPAFLYTTASNVVHESIRAYQKHETELLEDALLGQFVDLQQYLEHQEDVEIDEEKYVESVLQCLSEDKRKLYEAYYMKKIPMAQIAKEYGISQVSLRMRYVRLRKEMKEIIGDVITNVFEKI